MKFGLDEKTVKMLGNVFKKYPEVKRVQIFGSRALGNYRSNSDIDLVLWDEIDEKLLGTLNQELDELPLAYKFFAEITHEALRRHIEGYEKDLFTV